jgi:hypothetical protein
VAVYLKRYALQLGECMKNASYLFLVLLLLQGCAGTRYSYTSLIEQTDDVSVLRVQRGTVTELLAVGDGFPGWWGYYPGVISSSPDIASVDCKKARSVIPFREPGVIFGGEVCNLTAHKEGKATLYFGNKFAVDREGFEEKVDVIVE